MSNPGNVIFVCPRQGAKLGLMVFIYFPYKAAPEPPKSRKCLSYIQHHQGSQYPRDKLHVHKLLVKLNRNFNTDLLKVTSMLLLKLQYN